MSPDIFKGEAYEHLCTLAVEQGCSKGGWSMNTVLWIAVGVVVWLVIVPAAIVNLRMRRALAKEKKRKEVEKNNKSPDWRHLPERIYSFYLKWADGSVDCVFKVKAEFEHAAIEAFKEVQYDKVQTVIEALEEEGREPALYGYIQIDDGPMEETVIEPIDQKRLEIQSQIDELSRDLGETEKDLKKSLEFDLELMEKFKELLAITREHLEETDAHSGLGKKKVVLPSE